MRNEKLDVFRGLAMLWVILVHCLYWLGYFGTIKSFLLIEMPLFFFISGASNGMASKKSLKEFYITRFQRLLIPYWIYSVICIVLIIVISPPETIKSFIKLILSWINPFGVHSTPIMYLTWALWFVPVYLLVMFIFPLFKRLQYSRYIPLVVMALLVCAFNFFGNSSRILLYYAKMLVFYGFFTYLGMFFIEIFEKRKTLPALLIVAICAVLICILVIFFGQSLNMQINKFPPNFMFFCFSSGALGVLYIFSDMIVNVIKIIRRNVVLDWIFQQYVKNGLTIFLFHPFVFLLLAWLKYNVLNGVNSKISFFIIFLLAIPLAAVVGKIFSWVEKIKIIK